MSIRPSRPLPSPNGRGRHKPFFVSAPCADDLLNIGIFLAGWLLGFKENDLAGVSPGSFNPAGCTCLPANERIDKHPWIRQLMAQAVHIARCNTDLSCFPDDLCINGEFRRQFVRQKRQARLSSGRANIHQCSGCIGPKIRCSHVHIPRTACCTSARVSSISIPKPHLG